MVCNKLELSSCSIIQLSIFIYEKRIKYHFLKSESKSFQGIYEVIYVVLDTQ